MIAVSTPEILKKARWVGCRLGLTRADAQIVLEKAKRERKKIINYQYSSCAALPIRALYTMRSEEKRKSEKHSNIPTRLPWNTHLSVKFQTNTRSSVDNDRLRGCHTGLCAIHRGRLARIVQAAKSSEAKQSTKSKTKSKSAVRSAKRVIFGGRFWRARALAVAV